MRNKTISVSESEQKLLFKRVLKLNKPCKLSDIINKTINGDSFEILEYIPDKSVDLIFADPPYNMDKKFKKEKFSRLSIEDYTVWLDEWISKLPRILKDTGSIYICGDWRSSAAIHLVCKKYFIIRSRITWEREKGRGANKNWKNCSEDIWFCTMSNNYKFNLDKVLMKRKVIAPYRDDNNKPKDWTDSEKDGKFRLTHPSNLWTDITVPFWSMAENTEHPTQKPEKLIAKIILASSDERDVVFDPFLGSGTTSVTAKKLKRNYIGIEKDEYYCAAAEKRLDEAGKNKTIQGYTEGVFTERNFRLKD